ncbi:TetR/AcrR family transcriptional regulator [Rhodococcus sp. LB1]|uniref:TetR/AcrR family transcriptional regulator n=1 Tax=Rhodococcus sp. LB1 TaxID=1807499 RepID=UPI00077A6D2B|nr:TetR/AcrR family transcriptional regulator [Rhodococcus sp. LB1]KXX58144.1 TetR family transcriptional regulator [Rhodococcus sp. LB1]
MARYGSEHKAQTRARVVEAAGRRLKKDGIDGAGVSALMSDAGLTNGAFYAHFASKDELVAVVLADQLTKQLDALRALPDDGYSLQSYIEGYLSASHRDQRENGCPSAALLGEISRSKPIVQESFTDGLGAMIAVVASRTHIDDTAAARTLAIGLMSSLIGTLQLSRAVSDPTLSNEILAAGLANAFRLIEN